MIRILHLSDPHFGAADPAIATRFLAQARELAPDLTVLSGDLTMRARRRELIEARSFVEHLPRPRLVIPGNHDIPALNQPLQRIFAPFKRYRETFGDELEPVHTAPGLHVVSMNSSKAFNTSIDWSLGVLSDAMSCDRCRHCWSSPRGIGSISCSAAISTARTSRRSGRRASGIAWSRKPPPCARPACRASRRAST